MSPDDDAYDAARRVWNGAIDKHPALIARCSCLEDVTAAVRVARSNEAPVAVRGGGHSVAGHGTCEDGMVIDLSRLKGIHVDPARSTAHVEPGVTWGELDQQTQRFGLATTGGLVSSTGIAGFTLGGGIGWLHRQMGPACDNLLSAALVTAEGEAVTASNEGNADLLWGLRGGGGNFGIVTSFEFRLDFIGPTVLGGMMLYPHGRAREVLQAYRSLMASAPDELTLGFVFRKAPPSPALPKELHLAPIVALAGMYAGPVDDGVRTLRPLDVLGEPLANLMKPQGYTTVQSMTDRSWEPGFQNYWKAEYLAGLDDEAIETMIDFALRMPSEISDFKVVAMGGAIARVGEGETAFSHRRAPFVLNINARWTQPCDSETNTAWANDIWQAMRPFSGGGVYMNFLGDEGEDRVRAAYGPDKLERLGRLKAKYDPSNFFRQNQNIRPASGTRDERTS